MAWKVKMLGMKYENLSVDPQDPCKTPCIARHKPVIQLGEGVETIRTLWLSGKQNGEFWVQREILSQENNVENDSRASGTFLCHPQVHAHGTWE